MNNQSNQYTTQAHPEEDMDLARLILILWHYKYWIILVTSVATGLGYLLNFGAGLMRHGIVRAVNGLE